MPVSTPQLSSPRCLIASTVGLLPGPSCAAAIPVQPTPHAAAATTAIPRRLPIISLPPSSVLVARPVQAVLDRRRVPTLAAFRPEELAQPARERPGPVVAENPAVYPACGHDP